MSKLYGQVQGDYKNPRTACASKAVSASVQSYDGSITIELIEQGNLLNLVIFSSAGSERFGRVRWSGPLSEFIGFGVAIKRPPTQEDII